MPLKTRITELLGIKHPIIQGGMHYVGCACCAPIASAVTPCLARPPIESAREAAGRACAAPATDTPEGQPLPRRLALRA